MEQRPARRASVSVVVTAPAAARRTCSVRGAPALPVRCTCEAALAGGGDGGGGGDFALCDCWPGGTPPFFEPALRFWGAFAAYTVAVRPLLMRRASDGAQTCCAQVKAIISKLPQAVCTASGRAEPPARYVWKPCKKALERAERLFYRTSYVVRVPRCIPTAHSQCVPQCSRHDTHQRGRHAPRYRPCRRVVGGTRLPKCTPQPACSAGP